MAIPSKSDRPAWWCVDDGGCCWISWTKKKADTSFPLPYPFSSFSISSLGKVDFVPRSTPLFCLNKFLAAREGRGRDVHGEV